MCAHHRGNSPSTPRRSLRKSSSDHAKKKVSLLHQKNSASWERKRKPSVFRETNTQAFPPAEHIKQDSEFKIKPSSRSKKLYRFTRTFSEGFSESEPEDDWMFKSKESTKKSASVMLTKRKISQLAKYLKTPKISEVSVPKVVVQDFSKKSTPRFNHMKLKAFTAFLEGQSGNKVVDVSEVPKSDAWKRKISAVTKISSVTSKNDTDIIPSQPEKGSPNEADVSPTKTLKRINRSKLLAITSLTKLGKQEIDLIEIESDSDQEAETKKEQALTENENIKTATPHEKDESLKKDESLLKTTEENPVVDPDQEVTSKIAEEKEILGESLSENLSEEGPPLQSSDRNNELEEQRHDPQIVPVSSDRDLNPPELRKENFSQADFEKSKNSKTAAMFQRHGKLLEDNKSSSEKKGESKNKDEKSKRKNIFSCCLCCKKKN